jgi:hypothetical protein
VRYYLLAVALTFVLPCLGADSSGNSADEPAIVSHVKVLSDKAEDVSSLEAWKKTYIKDGMSDQDKAIAIWQTIVKYRNQTTPPNEFVQSSAHAHDPIKTINVYGYCQCCCCSSSIEGLGRYIGLNARGRCINTHSVPELQYDNAWHVFDAAIMNHFIKPDGKAASVDEVRAEVMGWLAKNPGYRGDDNKLRKFAANEGWKKGPELLAACKFYDVNGINPAGWFGWPSSMEEYDIQDAALYEYGPSMGYEVNIQLRPGERLTRNWFNKGLHINMPDGDPCLLNDRSALGFQTRLGDLAPGRIGNGMLEYNVPLASGKFKASALRVENLTSTADDKKSPAIHPIDPAKPATLIIRMPCSYVYHTGEVACTAQVGGNGSIKISLSDNQGLSWKDVGTIDKSGEQKFDIKKFVFRKYDYRLKFELTGAGTGLDTLRIAHDIQHSQAPLPIIVEGSNTISFSTGAQEGTITCEPNMNPDDAKQHGQISYLDLKPELKGLQPIQMRVGDSGAGEATFKISTPGEMTRLRMNFHWRARDAKDGYDVQVSFDDGKTFKSIEKLAGPTPGNTRYIVCSEVPKGTRQALVKLIGTQVNTTCLFDMRLDADYTEPNGGFRPVKITYLWEEDGKPKKDEHIARTATEKYKIDCGVKTVPKSVILELAE